MSKTSEASRNQECKVRLPGVCNFDPETTVPGHWNGYGMGGKHADLFIADVCSACHAVIDGHVHVDHLTKEQIKLYHAEGIFETLQDRLNEGLVSFK